MLPPPRQSLLVSSPDAAHANVSWCIARDDCAGFNVLGRYLSVLFYHKEKAKAAKSLSAEQEELDRLKQQYRASRAAAESLAAEQEPAA